MIKQINSPLCHLGEGPLWNVEEQKLYWTDILNRKIYRHNPQTGQSEEFWSGEMQVGGYAFNSDGSLILCTDKGVYNLNHNKTVKLFVVPMNEDERFNDIITDPKGRVFAGTLKDSLSDGTLFRLEKGKTPLPVLKNIGISNGMCFSSDHKNFYHTDSMARTITRFDYELESGDISNPSIIYQGIEENGFPDGITMDTDENIWIACWGASKVIKIDLKGQIIDEIKVPAIQPSSVTFGGKELKTLYITSACQGGDDIVKGLDAHGQFLGGYIYKAEVKTTGRVEFKSNF